MALSQAMAMSILDFSQEKIDVGVLDQLAYYLFNSPAGSREQKMAEEILQEFQGHESAWTRVHQILEESSQSETKYVALNILGSVINSQWKVLPPEQAEGIKTFIVQTVIKLSSTMESLRAEKMLLGKLNEVLILIVKQEWPSKWPSFISDIVGASKSSESLCQNNMQILKLLSEEVFDFSKGKMVQVKAQHLKDALCAEFAPIFELCSFVLGNSGTPSLISETLQTLLRFLSWIPTGYIFKTDLIPTLVTRFLNVPIFRNDTLSCLAEIAALPGEMASQMPPAELEEIKLRQADLFQMIMEQLIEMLPPDTDLQGSWADADMEQQNFIRALSLFLSGWLKEHSALLEGSPERHPVLIQAIQYLLMISTVDDKEIFKICLEYWNQLTGSLYHDSAAIRSPFSSGLMLHQSTPRRELYAQVLSQLRLVMIQNMAKPEEVLVVERDDGEVVREVVKDTDSSELYKNMRVTLVYLTHLDYRDTDAIMTEKLKRQMDGSEWSYKNLNTLCWAIGSISGTMSVEDEKRFLVNVIKDLLSLCEMKRGKDAKAIIASNIMYIVGQYPRFLRDHWKFLKTVINKLFEFMHETHAGVQDMACDTFIKIAQKCKKHFIHVQVGEVVPFIDEILSTIQSIICDLEPQQVHTFYEAIGCMISAQTDQVTRNQLIEKLMNIPNKLWASIIMEASQDIGVLQNMDAVKQLSNVLKTNVAACRRIGHPFIHQLGNIYLDMLHVYKTMGDAINHAIATQGEMVMSQPLFHAMRSVRSEILRLIGTWISKSEDPEAVMTNIIPSLLEAVLSNYESSIPVARDPQVLSTMSTIVERLRGYLSGVVGSIFGSVFESTLSMINQDFETFPEHRRNFYTLLCSIVSHCFDAFAGFSEDQFKMLIDAIVWGFQHPMRDVADAALKTTDRLIEQVASSSMAQGFFKTFYLDLMQSLFAVVTDSVHFGGINFHAIILARMFSLVEQGAITVPLQDENPAMTNQDFVRQFVMNLIQTAMPHLQAAQLTVIVDGFYACNLDQAAFKAHLRDFLVQCKEMLGQDLGDLFLQERMAQLEQVQQEKMQKIQSVPGMLNPNQISFLEEGEEEADEDAF